MRQALFLAVVAVVAVAAGSARAATAPVTLQLGQGVAIRGTDLVCAYGGPANATGLACLHTKGGTFSFRLDENELLAFQTRGSGPHRVGRWQETKTTAQAKTPAVSDFKLAGTVAIGGRFLAAGTDLGCLVYNHANRPNVACFKLGPGKGYAAVGSYAIAIDAAGIQVSRFDASHQGTTVYVGRETK